LLVSYRLLSDPETPPLPSSDTTHELINKIYESIKKIPSDAELSDPKTFHALPFPSILEMPICFTEIETDPTGVEHFEYMGRSKFSQLLERIQQSTFLEAREMLCVYGTSGCGKSHLLAALVCHLIREGKRVVYLPDCCRLLREPRQVIQRALLFAFHDKGDFDTIKKTNDVNVLIKFMSRRNLYVVVDQTNGLELTLDDDSAAEKRQARAWLGLMISGHRYIFGASANQKSSREVHRKQNGVGVFYILGGMTEVC
jgi:energy-coupling factor transporter ATP-binding protein EcfA2